MQIILKQKDIEAALKLYVAQKGISLAGKTVDIQFTAGRKEAGITAEVDIEDADELPAAAPKPLKLVSEPAPEPKAEAKEPVAAVLAADTEEVPAAEAAPVAKASSLFG